MTQDVLQLMVILVGIKNNEEEMHENWDAQFLNTTTPIFATQLLKQFYETKLLSKKSTKFLYNTMVATVVGKNI